MTDLSATNNQDLVIKLPDGYEVRRPAGQTVFWFYRDDKAWHGSALPLLIAALKRIEELETALYETEKTID